MQRQFIFIFAFLLFSFYSSIAQSVGVGTANPNASAQLDVTSTNKGFLPPRMTLAQRNGIVNPASGLMVYCTDCGSGEMQYYKGNVWVKTVESSAEIPVPSVTIGNQIWSSKNLDVVTYRNGDIIPQVTDPVEWANLTTGAWCWYNNDHTNNGTYGKLYNGYAINDPRGLAPIGWHVASSNDWGALVNFFGGTEVAGGKMKSIGTIEQKSGLWFSPNTGATDENGFTAFPGGSRNANGAFGDAGSYGAWWIYESNSQLELAFDQVYISVLAGGLNAGYSVRIVKD